MMSSGTSTNPSTGRSGILARLDAHDLLPLVRTGVVWTNGYRVERTEPRTERKAGTVAA